jgi:uncharacterized membrane protein YjjP (DUF1212 family)
LVREAPRYQRLPDQRVGATCANGAPRPSDIATKLAEIESTAPAYSPAQIAVAISAACGGFAFLNGAGILEVIAAAIAGAVGQGVRGWLSRRRLTQYGVTAVCVLVASAIYSLVAWIPAQFGLSLEHHTTGLFASVLFLIPGFPLVAALLDLVAVSGGSRRDAFRTLRNDTASRYFRA